MSVTKYEHFIPQNIAPKTAKRIGIYNARDGKVGQFELQKLTLAPKAEKLYSFGLISDVHIGNASANAESDFTRAIEFFMEHGADFTCVCGDLTQNGTIAEYEKYPELRNSYSHEIRSITGNHDNYSIGADAVEGLVQTYTGDPLYYSFEKSGDVFVMVGIIDEGQHFTDAELQWFKETLEANRNKRCFVLQHIFPSNGAVDTCGNAYGLYNNSCWHAWYGEKYRSEGFINPIKNHPNAIFFHGHSHIVFELQSKGCSHANYSVNDGYRSVHIPSVTVPRTTDKDGNGSPDKIDEGSQGYIVDVYKNGIHLQGVDFAKCEFLPIASYWIDTSTKV